jgi:hypothetical protein
MKTGYLVVLFAMVLAATPIWAADAPRSADLNKSAHGIIEKKCTSCHGEKVIDAALSSNKDMERIQKEMEKKGAKLNANESEVLGIYWKQQYPLKKGK